MEDSINYKIFECFEQSRCKYLRFEDISAALQDMDSIVAGVGLIGIVVSHLPLLAAQQLYLYILILLQRPSLRFLVLIRKLLKPAELLVLAFTDALKFDPLVFFEETQPAELYVGDLSEEGVHLAELRSRDRCAVADLRTNHEMDSMGR